MTDQLTGCKSPGYLQAIDNIAYYTNYYTQQVVEHLANEGVLIESETDNEYFETVDKKFREMFPDEFDNLDEAFEITCKTYDVSWWKAKLDLSAQIEELALEYYGHVIDDFLNNGGV